MKTNNFGGIEKKRFINGLFLVVILCSLLIIRTLGAAPAMEPTAEAAPKQSDEIQKTIAILEDDEKRAEVVKLLRLMELLNSEKAAAAPEEAEETESTAPPSGFKAYLQNLAGGAVRGLSVSGIALEQSALEFRQVMKALSAPEAADLWRPYVLKTFAWGILCLLGTHIVLRKFNKIPAFQPTLAGRLKAALKYGLLVGGPNLVLIITLLALPGLSTTTRGVTVDMATGFTFIHAFMQHFFINLAGLYIFLRVVSILFERNAQGHALIDIHPVLARHFQHSFKILAVYLACFVFFKETFLENFVTGILYSIALIALVLPVSIYLTIRLRELNRLFFTIGEAEATAAGSEKNETAPAYESGVPRKPDLDFRADLFIKRHWSTIAVAVVWILAFIFLLNPADASDRFVGRSVATLVIIGLAGLTIKIARLLMARFVSHNTDSGRIFLLNLDNLANAVVWLGTAGLLLATWGLPLERIIRNDITRDIIGRALTIFITLAALTVFMRYSRIVTAWLLSVPNLARNRNWRTMTPLALTAARALAIFITMVVILERLGVNIGPILAGAGILGLGVGMGAQSLVKDIINGLSILLMDTLSVGDYVTIAGQSGTVDNVGLRTIRLRDGAGNLIVVPNSTVDSIVNMTRDYSQDLIEFITPFDADPDEMLKMATDVAQDLSDDPDWLIYMYSPVQVVGIVGFDQNGTTIRMKINTTAGTQWLVGRELRLRLKRRMLQMDIKSTWFGQNVFLFNGDPECRVPAAGPAPAKGGPPAGSRDKPCDGK